MISRRDLTEVIQIYVENCFNELRARFSRLPLIGPLVDCDRDVHWAAFCETFVNSIVSTMPFWLAVVVAYPYQIPLDLKEGFFNIVIIKELLSNNFRNGELFIFSTSILAPVMFITWSDLKGKRDFPAKLSLGITSLVTMLISTGLFSALKANSAVNEYIILYLSAWLACFAVLLSYIAAVYHKYRQGTPEQLKDDEKDYVEKFLGHR